MSKSFSSLVMKRGLIAIVGLFALRCDAASEGVIEKPFADRSGPKGATLFHRMAPEETGVKTENKYADPKMWGERYHEFEVGAVGTGVAVADYDNDGRPDIFVVSKTESCRLFRNLGNWKFEDVTERAGVIDTGAAAAIWKQGATFADLNNDGRLDLYVCRFGAPNLLYINQGDGTFKEEAAARGLAVVDGSVVGAFCDYDRDGSLDVFVLTNMLDAAAHPNGQRPYLFHNRGDGIFENVTDKAGIRGEGQGHSATWWDFDHDGWPDLYVANDFAGPDRLYRNQRDGTFAEVIDHVVPHTSLSSMGSDIGDVNNDGLIDLFVADMAATTHEKDQRTMAQMRALATDPGVGSTAAPQYPRNALYLATGLERCLEAATLAGIGATDWTWAPRFEDLDNDGRLDLFVTNGMHREAHNADLMARMMTAPSVAQKVQLEKASPVLNEANLAYRNRGDLRFESIGAAWGLDEKGVSFGAAFGDFDGDGDLDVVYSNYQKGATLLRNDSESGHRVIFSLRGTRSNRFGVGATVSIETEAGVQVRQLAIARGVLSSSEPTLHFGLGDDSQIMRATVSWPSGTVQVLEKLGVDREITVTEPDTGPAILPAERPKRTSLFAEVSEPRQLALTSREAVIDEVDQQPLLPIRQNRIGPRLAVGDLDGDGQPDVVMGGTSVDAARVLIGGKAAPLIDAASQVNDGPMVIFDANGDGANDLLITRGGSSLAAGSAEYQPKLWLNSGHGALRPAPESALPPLPISAGAVAEADFDHDGKIDVFIGGGVLPGAYPASSPSALLHNQGERFENATASVAPALRDLGLVRAAVWADVDRDGWADLIVAAEWGAVRCFHNEKGKSFADWSERLGFSSAGTGWWTSLAEADFNGDGRPDFVAGNLGLNTAYQADTAHPITLYAGDFKGDGSEQLIEAYSEGETIFPRRTRKVLGSAIPSILKKFPRNDPYARASLTEILTETKLGAAQRWTTNELRSGVFLSQSDGTYRFQPLPRLAQISPIQAVVTGDFDGDGTVDIVAVQNSYAPIPSVGRFDGGLGWLLRGDGHGSFTVVSPADSGVVVPGDARDVVAWDFDHDGRLDLFVTRNNSTTLAFRYTGSPTKPTPPNNR